VQNYILHIDLVYRYFSDFLDFVVENSKSRVSVYNHSIPKLRTPWTAKTYALYDIFRPYPASRHQHPVTHNANLWLGVADVAGTFSLDFSPSDIFPGHFLPGNIPPHLGHSPRLLNGKFETGTNPYSLL